MTERYAVKQHNLY